MGKFGTRSDGSTREAYEKTLSENSPSDAAPSQTPGHPAVGGFCPEKRGNKD